MDRPIVQPTAQPIAQPIVQPIAQPTVTLVAGPAGAGKTTWILQQIASGQTQVLYSCLGSESVPIDPVRVQTECQNVSTIAPDDIAGSIARDLPFYIEIGAHLDVASLQFPIACQRIAIAAPSQSEWQTWADQVISSPTAVNSAATDIWQASLTGQVLDPASLNVLWYELTEGAYGRVQRAKGIFDVADGRCFHFSFVAGLDSDYLELPLPPCTTGRPNRFSGIEVVGTGLDQSAIAQTLQDCCLSDSVLMHYQEQLKATLGEIPEETFV